MSRPTRVVKSNHGVTGIGIGSEAITLTSRVTSGPVSTIGRDLEMFLDADSIGFLLSTLAGMPAWQAGLKNIATEIVAYENTRDDPDTTPVTRVGLRNALIYSVRKAVREALTLHANTRRVNGG